MSHSIKSQTPVALERPAVILSFDAEQIWGQLDRMSEAQFSARYPDTTRAYDRLLEMLCQANVSATWLVVGGMALQGSSGGSDPRFSGLPRRWAGFIPAGSESSAPLWYRPSFLQRLKRAQPEQEIGLHGGLTHLIWTDPESVHEAIEWELFQGLKAFRDMTIRPLSFSYTRNRVSRREILPDHGFLCYRGLPPIRSEGWGRSLPGAALRALEEFGRFTPPPVFPIEELSGRLWNIPASGFLYPLAKYRTCLIPLHTRLERFERGLHAAIRCKGLFHFCLHPANLAEHELGFALFETMMDNLVRLRDAGDLEVLTMSALARRLEASRAQSAAGHRPVAAASEISLAQHS